MGEVVGGIDLSRYQEGPNDFAAVAGSGRVFAVQRWSVGPYPDGSRIRHLTGIGDAGLIPGAYHVLSAYHDPIDQAREFYHQVRTFLGEIYDVVTRPFLWTLDAEHSNSVGDPTAAQCRDFLAELARLTGRPPLAYIPKWWMVGQDWTVGDVAAVAATGALWWQSRYSLTTNFARPAETLYGWQASFWQYTSSAQVPGIPGRCDDNVFYGTAAQLAAVAGAHPTATPPEEDKMLWLIKGADRDEWWLTDWMTKRHIASVEDAEVIVWCQAAAGRPVQTQPGGGPHILGADQQDVIDRIPILAELVD